MRKVKSPFSKLELYTDDIVKAIEYNETVRRRAAGQYAVRVMKKNVGVKGRSNPGAYPGRRSGQLRRGIGMKLLKGFHSVQVGSRAPHTHLLEFGHGDGKERNKRPFVFPSLRKAEPEVIRIMSREYF